MEIKTISFSANDQVLTKESGSDNFVSNAVSYVKAEFSLGTGWTRADYNTVNAVWHSVFATISTVLDANNSCMVPVEMLAYNCDVYVNLVGTVVEDDTVSYRLTTEKAKAFAVNKIAEIEGSETTEITPSQFEQFVNEVRAEAEAIDNYTYDSEAWAKGTRAGVPVASTDPTYHNNSKYYADQGAALEQEVTDLKSALSDVNDALSDWVTVSAISGGYISKNTGALVEGDTVYHYTDYVSANTLTPFKVTARAYNNTCVAYSYDKNKNPLRAYMAGTNTATTYTDVVITPLSDEKYFRFSTSNASTTPLNVRKYAIIVTQAEIEEIIGNVDEIKDSMMAYVPISVLDGYAILKSNGTLSSGDAYQYTDYIACTQESKFKVTARAYGTVCCGYSYDASKNPLRAYMAVGNTGQTYTEELITPLADEKYFRFSTVNKVTVPLVVKQLIYDDNIAEEIIDIYKKIPANPLYGKTLLNFGDSIAAGDGNSGKAYADYIAIDNAMTLYDYSHGGDTLTTIRDNNIISQVNDAISDHSSDTIDYIFIEGGTNDIGNSAPLGEIVDGYDITSPVRDNGTIYGAVETIIAQLRNAFPTAKIIFVTTHKMATRSSRGQENCHKAILETSEKWSLPIADIYLHGQINSNITAMLPSCFPAHPEDPTTYPTGYDRTHPSEGGYKRFYVPYIVGVMRTI